MGGKSMDAKQHGAAVEHVMSSHVSAPGVMQSASQQLEGTSDRTVAKPGSGMPEPQTSADKTKQTKVDELFHKLDADNNGQIAEAGEVVQLAKWIYESFPQLKKQLRTSGMTGMANLISNELDTNHDNEVSLDEFRHFYAAQTASGKSMDAKQHDTAVDAEPGSG